MLVSCHYTIILLLRSFYWIMQHIIETRKHCRIMFSIYFSCIWYNDTARVSRRWLHWAERGGGRRTTGATDAASAPQTPPARHSQVDRAVIAAKGPQQTDGLPTGSDNWTQWRGGGRNRPEILTQKAPPADGWRMKMARRVSAPTERCRLDTWTDEQPPAALTPSRRFQIVPRTDKLMECDVLAEISP